MIQPSHLLFREMDVIWIQIHLTDHRFRQPGDTFSLPLIITNLVKTVAVKSFLAHNELVEHIAGNIYISVLSAACPQLIIAIFIFQIDRLIESARMVVHFSCFLDARQSPDCFEGGVEFVSEGTGWDVHRSGRWTSFRYWAV